MHAQTYKESHESSPVFRFWAPPSQGQYLNALFGLLRRTYELPMTRDERHEDAPLHQVSGSACSQMVALGAQHFKVRVVEDNFAEHSRPRLF